MSREVRRVPLDWQHPQEPNEHWVFQHASRLRRGRPESKLSTPGMRFVGLMDDYAGRLAQWEQECADIANRTGWDWNWNVEYHLTGYKGRDDATAVVHPFWTWDDDGNEQAITVRDEDHLHELMTAKVQTEKPDPANYMPTWDSPEGWCLYETVSEGTPVTPVFATAAELIDHLATVGMDWDQEPLRRSAAEALVGAGGSFASFVAVGGVLYDGAKDADKLPPGALA